ncbi:MULTISPECIES: VOC family protein [unclassified Rathayibacter]|uniref:VOC family protein n=1 Tax=unclassified Rathayibacter TaxID=2609250 RepID=UPI00188C73F8|nr:MULTISPECIES: VOC family protein [unclassified Rathayibacter]MBF4461778.1 VOC family protein [Rathayibacter sp. VKM Ac-2879]MBF4503190.1 VOC family protein [Rathayibacter sp. VKM Ac-2878]
MSSSLSPYIGFDGQAKEAMEYYRGVFGGELMSSTFADFQASEDPADQDRIMHAQLVTPNGLILMGSDTPSSMPADTGSRISVALFGDDHAELTGYWEALADGGTVTMPLDASPWGDHFGMLVDRFSVAWMVNISATPA